MSQDGMRCLPDSRSKGGNAKKEGGDTEDTGILTTCKDANREYTQQGENTQADADGRYAVRQLQTMQNRGSRSPCFFCRERSFPSQEFVGSGILYGPFGLSV